jgi:hypothetical protein
MNQEILEQVNKIRKEASLPILSHQDLIVQGFMWSIQTGGHDIIKQIYELIKQNKQEFVKNFCLNCTIVPPIKPNQVVLIYESSGPTYQQTFSKEQFMPAVDHDTNIFQYVNMHFPFKFFIMLKSETNPTNLFNKLKIETKTRVAIPSGDRTLYVFNIVCRDYNAYIKKIHKKYTFFIEGENKCIKLPFLNTLPENYLDYMVSVT